MYVLHSFLQFWVLSNLWLHLGHFECHLILVGNTTSINAKMGGTDFSFTYQQLCDISNFSGSRQKKISFPFTVFCLQVYLSAFAFHPLYITQQWPVFIGIRLHRASTERDKPDLS